MTPDLNRAEKSALHIAMLTGLNLPTKIADDEETYRRQAWCETICWAECPGDVFRLSDQIEFYLAEYDYVEVDAADLRKIEGSESVNLALRLNCIRPRPNGRVDTVWTNCPPGARGKQIKLPGELE